MHICFALPSDPWLRCRERRKKSCKRRQHVIRRRGSREELADLNIGPRALRECRVEELEEGIHRRATYGGWVGAEEGCRQSRLSYGELGGRHESNEAVNRPLNGLADSLRRDGGRDSDGWAERRDMCVVVV